MNLVLYGSGEFTDEVIEIDEHIIEVFGIKSIAVIPTAAGQEADVDKWFSMAEDHFKDLHVAVIRVPIFNEGDANNSKLVELIAPADWIFFSGGDPNYLLQVLTGSLLWTAVIERHKSGTLLGGSSAGAMVMGSAIMSHMFKAFFTREATSWSPAFGLVNYRIFPHFDRFKTNSFIMKRLIEGKKGSANPTWMGIDEDTAIMFHDGRQDIMGQGTVETGPND